ncbi:MAG: hypothetical protein IT554_02965 [Sphingomonadaceae bacterium]|nr:hypothetical protein [Sphingomonadaceae bacterium]
MENHAIGGRDEDGNWYDAQNEDALPGEYAFCTGALGERELRLIKIVCTVAHVDGKLEDHSDDNLRFWCQQCHLRHDAKQHAEQARLTRLAKLGQGELNV